MIWDLFISHASEDKADIARPLTDMLRAKGLEVWYDEYTLRIGDSLRRSIDNGLAKSRYGVVILSPSFFAKNWTQKELEGLFSLESAEKDRILPVWHNVSAADVKAFSPMLAGRVGISTADGMDYLVVSILKKVSSYRIADHHGRKWDIDVSDCKAHDVPVAPAWLATDPKRMSSAWLVERLTTGAELRLYYGRNWYGGTWFVVDVLREDGEVINLDQLNDLKPSSATTTTTTTTPTPQPHAQ
jgi:hypothetical protein